MYLALARKYRPQLFDDLIGQPHITKTLQNAIKMDKLYPSLIFSGMKGVGKTSAARILAKALNCEKGPSIEPCNSCEICSEITRDMSPDYIEIDGASNNGVEEVRSLKEKVKYKPFKNRFRVVVIDEVHMLSNSAWNALLKTIEEPPEFTYFIMATTDFHKIPATIISRCQHFEFKQIPYEVIITLLKEICAKEKITISDYALFLISKASEGSLRDAKKILDQAIALSEGGNVQDQNVIDILGIIDEDVFITLTKNVLSKNRREIIEQISNLCERGMDLRFFYSEYLKFLRDLMVLKSVEDSEKLHNLNPENLPILKKILKNVREIELLRYFNAAKDLEITIKNTENPRIILEYMFLKLSYFPSLVAIEELIQHGRIKPKSDNNPSPGETSSFSDKTNFPPPMEKNLPNNEEQFSSGEGTKEIPNEELKSIILEKVQKENPRWVSALESATFLINDDSLVLKIANEFEVVYTSMKEKVDFFKKIVTTMLGEDASVDITLDKSSLKKKKTKIEDLKGDEKINDLMKTIKGKIVSIE
jgi:DNA polymerase-3 subunit gamma/tau